MIIFVLSTAISTHQVDHYVSVPCRGSGIIAWVKPIHYPNQPDSRVASDGAEDADDAG
jgi:hypothetical protein